MNKSRKDALFTHLQKLSTIEKEMLLFHLTGYCAEDRKFWQGIKDFLPKEKEEKNEQETI